MMLHMDAANGAAAKQRGKKMKVIQERSKQDCNWIVGQSVAMRKQVLAARLVGVVGLEARLAVKIEVAAMDYNELLRAA